MTDPVPGGLPAGYALRRPRGDDLDEVVALIAAADLAASGETCASGDCCVPNSFPGTKRRKRLGKC